MTECSRCGDCCDPVIVVFDPKDLAAEKLADLPDDAPDWERYQYEFFRDHWTSTSTFEVDEGFGRITVHRVQCDQFDRDSRTCRAHDRRPQVCSGFPWYGRPEHDVESRAQVASSLSPRCSFNADVPGRRMLPIVEVS
jgi:Fe-S-cluster containining protein